MTANVNNVTTTMANLTVGACPPPAITWSFRPLTISHLPLELPDRISAVLLCVVISSRRGNILAGPTNFELDRITAINTNLAFRCGNPQPVIFTAVQSDFIIKTSLKEIDTNNEYILGESTLSRNYLLVQPGHGLLQLYQTGPLLEYRLQYQNLPFIPQLPISEVLIRAIQYSGCSPYEYRSLHNWFIRQNPVNATYAAWSRGRTRKDGQLNEKYSWASDIAYLIGWVAAPPRLPEEAPLKYNAYRPLPALFKENEQPNQFTENTFVSIDGAVTFTVRNTVTIPRYFQSALFFLRQVNVNFGINNNNNGAFTLATTQTSPGTILHFFVLEGNYDKVLWACKQLANPFVLFENSLSAISLAKLLQEANPNDNTRKRILLLMEEYHSWITARSILQMNEQRKVETEEEYLFPHGADASINGIGTALILAGIGPGDTYFQPQDRQELARSLLSLKEVLLTLGFKVSLHTECTKDTILRNITYYCDSERHVESDAFFLFIFAHGEDHGFFQGCDGERINFANEVIHPIQRVSSLRRKPKIIVLNACRGTIVHNGVDTDVFPDLEGIAVPEAPNLAKIIHLETFLRADRANSADSIVMYSAAQRNIAPGLLYLNQFIIALQTLRGSEDKLFEFALSHLHRLLALKVAFAVLLRDGFPSPEYTSSLTKKLRLIFVDQHMFSN